MATYLFENTIIYDLRQGAKVTINGERDVVFQDRGSVTIVFVFGLKVVASLELPSNFNLAAFREELLGRGFEYPDPDYVILCRDLQDSNAKRIA